MYSDSCAFNDFVGVGTGVGPSEGGLSDGARCAYLAEARLLDGKVSGNFPTIASLAFLSYTQASTLWAFRELKGKEDVCVGNARIGGEQRAPGRQILSSPCPNGIPAGVGIVHTCRNNVPVMKSG